MVFNFVSRKQNLGYNVTIIICCCYYLHCNFVVNKEFFINTDICTIVK